jgi:exodeoxyribonuclease-3
LQLSVTTWNINSVRLRIEQVRRFLAARRPDVLCLQETKCPDDAFPAEGPAVLRLSVRELHGPEGL